MNAGATLDEILRLPYLEPTYDEPEFVARNVWRLYGGWWDGDPARLHPPSDVALAIEVASHSGGAAALGARAREIADAGD
ncbi:MAG: alkyl sulfatase dimerization domain-containing protein, partial [Acidimicrobiales bacterium]